MDRRTRGRGAGYEEQRSQITDAVLAVVAGQGLSAVSLTTVAAQAGMSAGRVQHYFPTKKGMIAAAFDRANAQSRARIREQVGQELKAADPRTVLTIVLTELIPYDSATRTHMRVRQAFAALALWDEDIAARLHIDYAAFHQEIADLLRRDQAAGRVAPGRPERMTLSLIALAEGLAYYVLIGLTPAAVARESVLAAIARTYG